MQCFPNNNNGGRKGDGAKVDRGVFCAMLKQKAISPTLIIIFVCAVSICL
jgi:hypothetical protein